MNNDTTIALNKGMDLGGFTLLRKIGEGGMGEVWLAEQESMSRTVALKILDPTLAANENFTARFLKEVKISAKLNHKNIVTAHDAGERDGLHFLAMSYVEGSNLDDILSKEECLSEKQSLTIARSIAEALDYAWSEFQILHRDIKPSNIIIDKQETPKLLDMGISKCLMEETSVTVTGTLLGTPSYISPEQGYGRDDLDCRSDIYSLGATLYHLLSGDAPFEGSTAMQVVMKHIHEHAPDIQVKKPDLSNQCTALIGKMMAKKREFRQKDWKELIKDIDLVLDGEFPADTEIEDSPEMELQDSDETLSTRVEAPPELSFDVSESAIIDSDLKESEGVASELPSGVNNEPKTRSKLAVTLFIIALILAVFSIIYFTQKDKKPSENEIDSLERDKILKVTDKEDDSLGIDINPISDDSATIDKSGNPDDIDTWLLKKSEEERKADKDAKDDKELDAIEAELNKKMEAGKDNSKKENTEDGKTTPSLDGTKWDDKTP